MIYLDNAATTAMSEAALQALIEISSNQFGNPSAVYGLGRKSKEVLEESRRIIAGCIGAEPEEIFFTSCGTESDNWVINQLGSAWKKTITSEIEHHAILYPAKKMRDKGFNVKFLPVNKDCLISTDALVKALDGTPALVSVMMQNNETGVIQDIKEMAKCVHADNEHSVFHTDAVQVVGHFNINVKDLSIDMLSASAHKFNGPKGVGFLYISKNCSVSPFILGGGQERGMRSGTENVAGIYSMAKALEDNVSCMEDIQARVASLDKLLVDTLTAEKIDFTINGCNRRRASGILNIAIKDIDGEGLLNMLDMHDVCISIGSACNSKSQDRSHVLTAMGIDNERIDSSIRISIGRYNTEDDIRILVKWLVKYSRITALADLYVVS